MAYTCLSLDCMIATLVINSSAPRHNPMPYRPLSNSAERFSSDKSGLIGQALSWRFVPSCRIMTDYTNAGDSFRNKTRGGLGHWAKKEYCCNFKGIDHGYSKVSRLNAKMEAPMKSRWVYSSDRQNQIMFEFCSTMILSMILDHKFPQSGHDWAESP